MDGGTLDLVIKTAVRLATRPAQGTTSSNTIQKPSISEPRAWSLGVSWGQSAGFFESYVCVQGILAGAATVTYDLYDGSLSDVTGVAAAFRTLQVAAVYQIANASGTAGSNSSGLVVGNAGANPHGLWFGAAAHTYSVVGIYGIPLVHGDQTGKTVDATHRAVLITNADAVNTATYVAVFAGRLS